MPFPEYTFELIAADPASLEGGTGKIGIQPFHSSNPSMEVVCRGTGLPWDALIQELSSLKFPGKDAEWDRLPLNHLLDFLFQEHWEFLQEFVPAVKNIITAGEVKPDFVGRLVHLI